MEKTKIEKLAAKIDAKVEFFEQTDIKMKSKETFDVISPDGFSIAFDAVYNGLEAARSAFKEWKTRYEKQGYYSSVKFGRIPLADLEKYCQFVKI